VGRVGCTLPHLSQLPARPKCPPHLVSGLADLEVLLVICLSVEAIQFQPRQRPGVWKAVALPPVGATLALPVISFNLLHFASSFPRARKARRVMEA
jgi:hypothetical protein